jgi:hypothetical protein
MQRKQNSLTSLVVAAALLALGALTQTQAADSKKADATGTWTWTAPARGGGAERKMTLKLKADGEKVTGTLSQPGQGGQTRDIEIKDGKLKGDELSFSTSVERGGNTITMKYNGKISGDRIKGKVEREGQGQPRDWEAKREVEKKS